MSCLMLSPQKLNYVANPQGGPLVSFISILRMADSRGECPNRLKSDFLSLHTPGLGLGLSLAEEIMRTHDSELRLIKSNETFSIFEMSLKKEPCTEQPPTTEFPT